VQVALLIKCFNLNLGRDRIIVCSNIKFLFDLFCFIFQNIYNKILMYLQLSYFLVLVRVFIYMMLLLMSQTL